MRSAGRPLRRLLAVVFLGVALVFVVALLRGQWDSLDRVLLAVVAGAMDLLLMGLVWAALFRWTGGSAGRPEAVRVWVITNFGRYIPGKIWQLGGLAAYMKGRGDSGAAALVCRVWTSKTLKFS